MKSRVVAHIGVMLLGMPLAVLADTPLVDQRSTSSSTSITREQLEALPHTDRYALELAGVAPNGDMSDVAGTGIGIHIRGGERLNNVFVIEGVGGWDMFGKKDATDLGFGETTINVFQFGPQVTVYPFRGGIGLGGPIVRNTSFFFSPRMANFAGKQEFQTQQGTQEFKFHSTEFSLTGGLRYDVYASRSTVISIQAEHSHVFTEGGQARDGGEGYWRFAGAFTYVPPQSTTTQVLEYGAQPFAPYGGRLTVEASAGCGYPLEPLNGSAGPGLNFDGTVLYQLYNNTRAVGEVDYQMFSEVGPINTDDSQDINLTQVEIGIRQDLPGLFHSFQPFIQGTVSPAWLNDSYEINGVKSENTDSGIFYNLTVGAARPLNDKTGLVTKFKYPLANMGFDYDAPKAPTVSLGIRRDF